MKYTVDKLEAEAKKTRKAYNGLSDSDPIKQTMKVGNMRTYIDKILFLIKTIRKLEKKIERYER